MGNGGNGERVLQEACSMLTSGFLFLDTAFDLSENKNIFYNYIGIIRHLKYLNILSDIIILAYLKLQMQLP